MAGRIMNCGVARAGAMAGIALAIGIAACAPPGAAPTSVAPVAATPTSAAALKRVRSSVAGALGQAGQYLAQSQGYFAEEGISVDLVQGDPSNSFTALLAGEVDVIGSAVDPGLFNAMQRGLDFRVVATQASSTQDANGVFFVVRRDLIDNRKVEGYADLKGLKIGIPTQGDEYVLAKALQAGGLRLGDVEPVILNFPATVTALGSGAIDVGVLPEPLATVAVQNGSGVKWKGYADVAPGIQQTVVAFSPQFMAQRDVATSWMTAYVRGLRDYGRSDRLSEDELLANAVLLLMNGHETTTCMIGNGLLAILRHPDQRRRLQDEPALIGPAVEELLRFDGSVQMRGVTAAEDVSIGGKLIGKGQSLLLLLGAANRDPARFADPDRLDLGRRDNAHLDFGRGIHFCIGAALARTELQIAITTILQRMPEVRLTSVTVEWQTAPPIFRGLKALPVAF